MPYVYAPLKKRLYPTYEEASKAVTMADTEGNGRDVRPLMSILQRMAESSDRIVGNLQTRQTALTAFGWSIEPVDDGADEALLDRAAMTRARLAQLINRLLMWHTDTIAYGVSAVEVDWAQPEGGTMGLVPKVLARYRPTEIERGDADPSSILILADGNTLSRMPLDLATPGKVVADVDGFYQVGGLLRVVMWLDLMRNEALQEWVRFNQKLKGVMLARLEEWASKDDKATAAAAMSGLAKDQFAIVTKAVEFNFQSMVNQLGSASYKDFISMTQDAISVILLGQANTSRLPDGGGSRAALEILNLIRADIHFADIARMERIINDRVVAADSLLNGGATVSPFRFRINLEEDEDQEGNARLIGEALDAGIPLKRAEVYRRIGFTEPIEGDDVIQKQAGGFGL